MEPGTALRGWLGLPPGVWPPDHYALLALTPGTGDVDEIEARVLDRMEHLRAHQLLHPETVTEGMNRLAQALVCLTDPVARAAYDRQLGIAPAPFEVVEDEPFSPAPDAEPLHLPYELVEPDPRPSGTPPFEVVYDGPDDAAAEPAAAAPLPAPEVLPGAPSPSARATRKVPKLSRRTIYRRLAALRRATRAWEALRPVFGTPGEALSTPVAVLLFLRALADARAAFPGAAFVFHEAPRAGAVVVALVRLPSVLATVRTLLPSQRKAVARDWHNGYVRLGYERNALRKLARRPRRGRRLGSGALRLARNTPELVLALLAVLLVLGAAIQRNR